MKTELENAILEFYKRNPELIIGFGEWETIKQCANCGGVIEDDDPCLFHTRNGINEKVNFDSHRVANNIPGTGVMSSHVACPHCLVFNNTRYWAKSMPNKEKKAMPDISESDPIKIKILFRRKVWLSKKRRKLFRWIGEDKFVWEYEENALTPTVQT